MRKKMLLIIFFIVSIVSVWSVNVYALKEDTHRAINEHIARETINGFSVDTYLKNNLGFVAGSQEDVYGYAETYNKYLTQRVWKWIGEGGIQEDRPGSIEDFAKGVPTRSVNHFHNPLKEWDEAGLNDISSGQSSVLWGQNQNQSTGGKWSWQDARRYFYIALTGRDFDGAVMASTNEERSNYYARTFRAIGQQMHPIHDASVPEHVRNDAHGLPSFSNLVPGREEYESYIERVRVQNSGLWSTWISNPITFDKSILAISAADTPAPVAISRIIDADKYTGVNPSITVTDTTLQDGQLVGLSEYTNANFPKPRHHVHKRFYSE